MTGPAPRRARLTARDQPGDGGRQETGPAGLTVSAAVVGHLAEYDGARIGFAGRSHRLAASALIAKVAEEQTAYCPDIVDQGTGTTTALAEQQVFSHTWFFWWD